tara:strand:- start:1890 stop:2126 length:237 start_codon:yes stop_codon:yes gene_type:complete
MGTTIKQAQRAIDKAGIPLEIVRGEGYHYFIYDVAARNIYETVSIYVPYTKQYTAAEWANQAGLAHCNIIDFIKRREG